MRLKEKVALVTGAGAGIGRAISTTFADEGAKVCVADIAAKEAAATVQMIQEGGGQASLVVGDVSLEADAERMTKETVAHYGRLDILVNNAGFWLVDRPDRVSDLSEQDWDRVLNVDLKGVFLCSKHALRQMISQGGGVIVNIASECGIVGFPNSAAYSAAKGGVVLLTKQMAIDYAPHNIRVNCVVPCNVMTPMMERDLQAGGGAELATRRYKKVMPLGRLGKPREVALATLFLASDESSFTTGSALAVDGGVTTGGTHTYHLAMD